MEGQSGLSELSVISWVSANQGCPLSGVPLYYAVSDQKQDDREGSNKFVATTYGYRTSLVNVAWYYGRDTVLHDIACEPKV